MAPMGRGGWLLLALAACSFRHGAAATADGPDYARLDGSGGSGSDADASPYCYGTAPFTVCLAGAPAGSPSLSGTVHTGSASDTMCEDGGYEKVMVGSVLACAVTGANLTIDGGSILRGEGTLPLVVVASGSLVIDGTVEVSSDTSGRVGAGADPAVCTSLSTSGSSNGGCGGGGAGGSFGTQGGDGGQGNSIQSTVGTARAADPGPVDTLRGGCPGAPGGSGGGTPGGQRSGGGAVYLVAAGSMTIDGAVDASGAGGEGARPSKAGGGGGGSGGWSQSLVQRASSAAWPSVMSAGVPAAPSPPLPPAPPPPPPPAATCVTSPVVGSLPGLAPLLASAPPPPPPPLAVNSALPLRLIRGASRAIRPPLPPPPPP